MFFLKKNFMCCTKYTSQYEIDTFKFLMKKKGCFQSMQLWDYFPSVLPQKLLVTLLLSLCLSCSSLIST